MIPADLVLVGRIAEPWGVKGGIKVTAFSNHPGALLAAKQWWLSGPSVDPLRNVDVFSAKAHGQGVVALLVGISDRDFAATLQGAQIHIERRLFPVLSPDEYYWTDLIGLEVLNLAQERLGVIVALIESHAHGVLEVQRTDANNQVTTQLIPFVNAYIDSVDLINRRVVVDWQLDY